MRPDTLAAGVLLATTSTASAGGPPQYEVEELPDVGDLFAITTPHDLNDDGLAVGDSLDDALVPRAVLWDDVMVEVLAGSADAPSSAVGVSASGLIAGWRDNASGQTEAAMWDGRGTLSFLGIPPGHFGTRAHDVNDDGTAVGWTVNGSGLEVAVRFSGGDITPLGEPVSLAFAINEAGQIVGRRDVTEGRQALLWEAGSTDPIVLPGLGGGLASPTRITGDGLIVGASLDAEDSKIHAVLWQPPGYDVVDLGLFMDHPTDAFGASDAGQVVGRATISVSPNVTRAVTWIDGEIHNLNDLIPADSDWTLQHAEAVNEAGLIVGFGERSSLSGKRAFLLTPVETTPGDLDGDGDVDVEDFLELLAQWGPCPDPPADCPGDFDGDGSVGVEDFLLLLANWT